MGSLCVLGFVGARVDCRCFFAPIRDLPGKCVPVMVAGGCVVVDACGEVVVDWVGVGVGVVGPNWVCAPVCLMCRVGGTQSAFGSTGFSHRGDLNGGGSVG